MSNNKQSSSVEWLVEQMLKQGYFDGNKPLTYTNLEHLQNQAEAMRKKEIEDAYEQGDADAYWELKENEPRIFKNKHEYYNETYGTK